MWVPPLSNVFKWTGYVSAAGSTIRSHLFHQPHFHVPLSLLAEKRCAVYEHKVCKAPTLRRSHSSSWCNEILRSFFTCQLDSMSAMVTLWVCPAGFFDHPAVPCLFGKAYEVKHYSAISLLPFCFLSCFLVLIAYACSHRLSGEAMIYQPIDLLICSV